MQTSQSAMLLSKYLESWYFDQWLLQLFIKIAHFAFYYIPQQSSFQSFFILLTPIKVYANVYVVEIILLK